MENQISKAGMLFGRLLLDIRRTDPERWERIKKRGAEIDAILAEKSQEEQRK